MVRGKGCFSILFIPLYFFQLRASPATEWDFQDELRSNLLSLPQLHRRRQEGHERHALREAGENARAGSHQLDPCLLARQHEDGSKLGPKQHAQSGQLCYHDQPGQLPCQRGKF